MALENSPPTPRTGLMLGLLAFAQLIISIDYNVVYVALPEIDEALGFSDHGLQWVVSAYALAFGGLLLLGGRACDLFGARRVYLAGLGLYAVGSAAGGLATTPDLVIVARAAQGVGGALLFPAVLTLIGTRFRDDAARNGAFAVWGTAGGAGMVLGSLLGGLLTQWFGWESVFWVNVPLALLTIALSLRAIAPDTEIPRGRSFDLGGALLATAGVTLVVFALVQGPELGWTDPSVVGSAGTGAALLALFVRVERRHPDPLLPGRLASHRNLRAGSLVTFLYMASFGALLYFLTVFFQVVQGRGALTTGLAFLVPMVGIVIGAQVGGRAVAGYGPRTVMVTSTLVGAAGAASTAVLLAPSVSYAVLVPGLLVMGLGQGSGWTVMFAGATRGIDPHDQGTASGIASTSQQIGGAAGLAVLVAVANAVAESAGVTGGLRAALGVATVGMVLTAAAATRFEGKDRLEPEPVAEPATARS